MKLFCNNILRVILICIINYILICLFRKRENDLQYPENRVCSIATDRRKTILYQLRLQ